MFGLQARLLAEWQGAIQAPADTGPDTAPTRGCPEMRADSPGLLLTVVGLVLVAGLLSAAEAALGGFSRARAEELDEDRGPGARRVLRILEDPPRYLNTALFLRLLAETSAVVLATLMIQARARQRALGGRGRVGRGHAGGLVRGDRGRAAHPRSTALRADRARLGRR